MIITFSGGPLNGKVYDWYEPEARILVPIMPPQKSHDPKESIVFRNAVYDQEHTNASTYVYQGES